MVNPTNFSRKVTTIMTFALLLAGALFVMAIPDGATDTVSAEPANRDGQGSLTKITNPRGNVLRGIDWKKGSDEAFIVGEGAVCLYDDSTHQLTQLDGPESVDHFYEDIAWRPQGDYGIIVGATPGKTGKGLVSKIWKEGATWRIASLETSLPYPITGVEWAPDGSYAFAVGGALSADAQDKGTILGRIAHPSNSWSELYKAPGSGLSDVEYNPDLDKFFAVGLDGTMFTYDGEFYVEVSDNKIKSSNMFSITWRDNGGRAIIGGWFGTTLKGHLLTTDGLYNQEIQETTKYINDADWAPNTDYTILVGQSGAIWEYSVNDALVPVDNTDTKFYYGVDFNDDGDSALIVGQDGVILQYNVTYPAQKNFAPAVNIESPSDGSSYDYGVEIIFDSNGTHDDDLDALDYEWTSSIDDALSDNTYFTTTTLTPGRHTITLTVDDAHGHTASSSINITIRTPTDPPRVDAGDDLIGYAGEDLTLHGNIIYAEFDIESYEWDYEGTDDFRGTIGPSVDYRYNTKGIYTASFRVTDIRKAQGTDSVIVTIFPKRSLADELVTIEPDDVFQRGDSVVVKINMSDAKKIEVQFVGPKGKTVAVLPTTEVGTFQTVLPKNLKKGNYDVKWRYFDHKNNKTDWYERSDAFRLKVPEANGNGMGDALPYIAAGIGIAIIVIVVVLVLMVLYKRSFTVLDVTILLYRDGRVMNLYTPPRTGKDAQPIGPEVINQVQGAVQGQIYNIQQGTQERLPTKIDLPNRVILIESGVNTLIATSYTGPEPDNFRKKMKNVLQEIEVLYGNQLRQWDGTVTSMPALQNTIAKNIKLGQ